MPYTTPWLISRASQVPRFRAKQHVRRVVAFRQVVERTTLFRVRQRICSTVVRDGQVTFLDVDVRSTVFTHCAEFDQVAIRRELFNRVQDVNGTHNVVRLRKDGTRSIHHRVRCRALLAKVYRGSRVEFFKRCAQKLVIRTASPMNNSIFLPETSSHLRTLSWMDLIGVKELKPS